MLQGECGSCWIFAATGAIETQNFRKTGELKSFSEQNMLDCVKTNISDGCKGGFPTDVFEWVIKNGISESKNYPCYIAESCECQDFKNSRNFITKFETIPTGSDADLQLAVHDFGTVSVGMDASQPSFQFYAQGIYFEPACDPNFINHAVLVVGYGAADDGTEYWIAKNSWSDLWGESGYFRIFKGNNHCGIATIASYPFI